MKINGIELEDIDLLDADTMEIVEDIFNNVETENTRISKISSMSEMIRNQCDYVSDCFDRLFGEGTSDKLFEGKSNMRIAISAFAELMNIIGDKQNEVEKEFSQYSPNRAIRRQNKR